MMSQYDERVERQRLKLKAEEWAKGVKSLHAHSLSSMWYDTMMVLLEENFKPEK